MSARFLLSFLLLFIFQFAHAADSASPAELWSALRGGGHVVMIRHAITESGIGDPQGFKQGDCSTQRNLSARGREDAKRMGEAFRTRNIPISEVYSSRWCRCLDTARIAFGKAKPTTMLDSMFNDREKPQEEKIREVFSAVANWSEKGEKSNLVLVTHNQNILELTGVSTSSGEMVLVKLDGPNKFKVVGRIEVSNF